MFRVKNFLRTISSGIACVFIVYFVLSGERKRDDFTDLVKDFTALIILADLDNNLRPPHLDTKFKTDEIDEKTLRKLLKNH